VSGFGRLAKLGKIATLTWLILHKGLFVGSWLVQMGLEVRCQVCGSKALENHEHCLKNYQVANHVWLAFDNIWRLWPKG
jgi:hypothetical protein